MKYIIFLLIANLILLMAVLYFVYTTSHEVVEINNQLFNLQLIDANPKI